MLDGVPQPFAFTDPIRRMLRIENALPLGFAEMPVVIDLVRPLIDESFARVIGGSRDDVVTFTPFDNSGFEPIERRTDSLPSRRRQKRRTREAPHWAKPNVWLRLRHSVSETTYTREDA